MAERNFRTDPGDHPPRRDSRGLRDGHRLGHDRQAAGEARLERLPPLPAQPRPREGGEAEPAMKVFFHVQHLLGIGHLRRAATLARAMAADGIEVTLASGGMPVEGIEVLQLPPASSDASFKTLLDERGQPVDDGWKARRRDALLAAWNAADADVLMIELFPFGRRQMRFELIPLLEAARSPRQGRSRRPLIVCSARDLIQWRPTRELEMLEFFERYFDRLLVHGDPAVARFNFGLIGKINDRLHYTGYVV